MSSESYTHYSSPSSESLGQKGSFIIKQHKHDEMPTERTSLLNTTTHERDSAFQDGAKAAMLRQELWTLVRFASPIFGLVFVLYLP